MEPSINSSTNINKTSDIILELERLVSNFRQDALRFAQEKISLDTFNQECIDIIKKFGELK